MWTLNGVERQHQMHLPTILCSPTLQEHRQQELEEVREQVDAKQTELSEVKEDLQQRTEREAVLNRDIAPTNRRLQVPPWFGNSACR